MFKLQGNASPHRDLASLQSSLRVPLLIFNDLHTAIPKKATWTLVEKVANNSNESKIQANVGTKLRRRSFLFFLVFTWIWEKLRTKIEPVCGDEFFFFLVFTRIWVNFVKENSETIGSVVEKLLIGFHV